MYILPDFASYVVMNEEGFQFEPVSQSFHSGPVLGIDVCVRFVGVREMRLPLVIALWVAGNRCWQHAAPIALCEFGISKLCSLRLWCFSMRKLILSLSTLMGYKYGASVCHPACSPLLQMLVGFSDKLRLMNILVDTVSPVREFAVCRGCREVQFSNGGQYFAAARDNNFIHVYDTYTFDCFAVLSVCYGNCIVRCRLTVVQGHNGKVRSIQWSADDTRIISTGHDGAVYLWDYLGDTPRKDVHIKKICSYTCAVITSDAQLIYAVGSDRFLKVSAMVSFGLPAVMNVVGNYG